MYYVDVQCKPSLWQFVYDVVKEVLLVLCYIVMRD